MKVLLIGEQAAGVRTLQSLAQSAAQIVAVMASPATQDGASLWNSAVKSGYATWPAAWARDPNFAAHVRERALPSTAIVDSELFENTDGRERTRRHLRNGTMLPAQARCPAQGRA